MKTKQLFEDWEEIELKNVGKIVTGNTPPKSEKRNYGKDIVWIKPPDLDKEKYVNDSNEKIANFAREKVRLLPKGSVLVSCIGIIGKVAIAEYELCTNQQINSIIPNKNIIDSEFLYYTLKKLRPFLEKQGSSAVVPLLNKSEFSKIKIPVPPLQTQKAIVKILEKVEKLKEQQKQSKEELDNLFNALMQKAFRGELVK